MIKYLAADLGHSYEEGETKLPCKIRYEILRKCLKRDAKTCKSLVFVCNDATDFESNDERAKRLFEALKLTGIPLENVTVLDNRTKKSAREAVQKADIIFLAGGKIFCQLDFYQSINFKQLLSDFHGILIGQSAGAMDMAGKGYTYAEDESELDDPKFFEGLGLTDINVIPHFDRKRGNDYCPPSLNILKTYREDSKNYNLKLLCLPNGSFVRIDEHGIAQVFGEAYEVRNGKIFTLSEEEKENYASKERAKSRNLE